MQRLIYILLIVSVTAVSAVAARRDRTTRHARTAVADVLAAIHTDTITDPDIRLSGYDKPATASREAIHVTNLTDGHVTEITVDIRYIDAQGRTLHTATVSLACDLPPGETDLVTWPSWDRQQSFYYTLSRKPSGRRAATPYSIEAKVVNAVVTSPSADSGQR